MEKFDQATGKASNNILAQTLQGDKNLNEIAKGQKKVNWDKLISGIQGHQRKVVQTIVKKTEVSKQQSPQPSEPAEEPKVEEKGTSKSEEKKSERETARENTSESQKSEKAEEQERPENTENTERTDKPKNESKKPKMGRPMAEQTPKD